jgi:hypothetical protein
MDSTTRKVVKYLVKHLEEFLPDELEVFKSPIFI